MSEEAVKVVSKASKRKKIREEGIEEVTYVTYNVALPKRFAEELGIKGGDILHVRIIEYEVDGKRVKGVFYYKP